MNINDLAKDHPNYGEVVKSPDGRLVCCLLYTSDAADD